MDNTCCPTINVIYFLLTPTNNYKLKNLIKISKKQMCESYIFFIQYKHTKVYIVKKSTILMANLDIVDKILEYLKNEEKGNINDITNDTYKFILPDQKKFLRLIELLKDIGMVKVEDDTIYITKMGLDYLELPQH